MITPRRAVATLADLFAPLRDPDEGSFLRTAVMNHRLSAEDLEAYAERLAPLDACRAEFLRLERLLTYPFPGAPATDAQRARYRELLDELSDDYGDWLACVRDATRVRNCGAAAAEAPRVRFRFQCPNAWQALAPTGDEAVRYCGDCRQQVYRCDTVEAAERHARAGDCIAVPAGLAQTAHHQPGVVVVGRPDYDQLWAERLFPGPPTDGESQ